MADFWTHVLHGVEVLKKLDDDHKAWLKRRGLFFLGLQGPDIFFYAYDKPNVTVWGSLIHGKQCGDFMEALLSSKGIPREYAFGFLCHQVMDRFSHRFIDHFDEFRPHKRRELSIDVAMVRRFLKRDYEQLRSWKLIENIRLHELPAEFAKVVRRVYEDKSFKVDTFEYAVERTASTLEMLYGNIEKTRKKVYLYWIFSLGGKDYTHLLPPKKLKDPLNLNHEVWIDPVTREKRRESFLELFETAVGETVSSIESVLKGEIPDTVHRSFDTDRPC